MSITICTQRMTSDPTPHSAEPATQTGTDEQAGTGERWTESWLPDRLIDRHRAVTAIVPADIVGTHAAQRRYRAQIAAWAAKLGLTGSDAVARLSALPRGCHGSSRDGVIT